MLNCRIPSGGMFYYGKNTQLCFSKSGCVCLLYRRASDSSRYILCSPSSGCIGSRPIGSDLWPWGRRPGAPAFWPSERDSRRDNHSCKIPPLHQAAHWHQAPLTPLMEQLRGLFCRNPLAMAPVPSGIPPVTEMHAHIPQLIRQIHHILTYATDKVLLYKRLADLRPEPLRHAYRFRTLFFLLWSAVSAPR